MVASNGEQDCIWEQTVYSQPDCSSPPASRLKPKVIQVRLFSLPSEFFYRLIKRLGFKCDLIVPEEFSFFPVSLGTFPSFCFFSSRSFHTSSLQSLLYLGAFPCLNCRESPHCCRFMSRTTMANFCPHTCVPFKSPGLLQLGVGFPRLETVTLCQLQLFWSRFFFE